MAKRDLIERLILFVAIVLGVIALRIWFLEPVTINEQMKNDYLANKDLILAVKNPKVDYGDFLVYKVDGQTYAGRVIAKANDTVTFMDDVLYRNEEIIHETYLQKQAGQEYFTEDLTIGSITQGQFQEVPKDAYLILNDDRRDHRDSRNFGLIKQDQVIGRLSFRITPFQDFGFIENGLAQ